MQQEFQSMSGTSTPTTPGTAGAAGMATSSSMTTTPTNPLVPHSPGLAKHYPVVKAIESYKKSADKLGCQVEVLAKKIDELKDIAMIKGEPNQKIKRGLRYSPKQNKEIIEYFVKKVVNDGAERWADSHFWTELLEENKSFSDENRTESGIKSHFRNAIIPRIYELYEMNSEIKNKVQIALGLHMASCKKDNVTDEEESE